jgi:transposase
VESIAEDGLWINALSPTALTQLLALEDLVVTALELVPWQARLYLHCMPTSPVATCPACHAASFQIHQYHRRTVRDLPWGPWACYLQLTRRRFWCARCARPFTEACPAVAPCARTTRRFAAALVAAVPAATIKAVAVAVGHGYHAVEGIFYRTAQTAHPPRPPAQRVRRLGIDEIAARKGHGPYKLVLVDLDRRVVIEQLPDRRKETLAAYLRTWSAQARAAVVEVAVDFWAAYHEVVAMLLPQACVVGDRFHVQKHLNDALNETRRTVQRTLNTEDATFVRKHRHLLLSNEDDLDAGNWMKLCVMKVAVPILDRVHTLKEEWRTLFNQTLRREAADAEVEAWLARARACDAPALLEFVGFVERWREPILNYFVARTTSGTVEGLNNKIKLVKRQAFGFRNDAHFRLRVLMACAEAG